MSEDHVPNRSEGVAGRPRGRGGEDRPLPEPVGQTAKPAAPSGTWTPARFWGTCPNPDCRGGYINLGRDPQWDRLCDTCKGDGLVAVTFEPSGHVGHVEERKAA